MYRIEVSRKYQNWFIRWHIQRGADHIHARFDFESLAIKGQSASSERNTLPSCHLLAQKRFTHRMYVFCHVIFEFYLVFWDFNVYNLDSINFPRYVIFGNRSVYLKASCLWNKAINGWTYDLVYIVQRHLINAFTSDFLHGSNCLCFSSSRSSRCLRAGRRDRQYVTCPCPCPPHTVPRRQSATLVYTRV